jgi:hypothetical protein
VRYEHEVEVHAATLGAGQVSDHHLCPQGLREDGEPTASPGLVLIRQSRKTLYLDGGRLLVAPTDWPILCTHYPFNFGSAAAVDRKLLRFADARNGSASRARQGGRKVENFESNGCARKARELCGEAHRGGDLRAREKVRERAGVSARESAHAESPGQFILSARESTLD